MRMTRITLFCSLLIALQGCHLFSSKNNKGDQITAVAAGKYLLADSLYKADPELDLDEDAFVLSDSANVYMVDDSTHIFRKVGIFHESDSIRVHVPMGRFMPFMNVYYSTAWHEKPAYIYGTDLGRKAWTDFDGDGRADQILYGYTDYDTSSFADVIGQHPMWLRFISAAGQRYELHDTGYSEININEVTDTSTIRFSKPTKVYYIDAGYPACGYAQYDIIIAFRNGKMHILHKDITSMDSGQGDFYEVGETIVIAEARGSRIIVERIKKA